MNIFDTIKKETQGLHGKLAVIEGDESITYGDLLTRAEQLAETLRAGGRSFSFGCRGPGLA